MKLLSITPTPNPNSMKLNVDERLAPGVKHTITPENKVNYPEVIQKLLAIPGVVSIFQVNDFLSIQRQPNADWEKILGNARQVLESEPASSPASPKGNQAVNVHFGEVTVSLQTFRRIPMLIKISDGKEEKRLAIPPRFQDAVTQASKASKNMLLERRWEILGVRYGAIDSVGETVIEEINAAYDEIRLKGLVEDAAHFDAAKGERQRLNEAQLREYLNSDDWQKRFAALSQLGANAKLVELFIRMAKDPKMNIRRLSVVYLGLIKGEKVLAPLCEALKDEAVAVRRTAGDCLTDLGDAAAIPNMIETLKDANKLVRWRAARFLFEHGDASALSALKAAAEDPEFEVRLQIAQAIERIESGGKAQGTVWQQVVRRAGQEENKEPAP